MDTNIFEMKKPFIDNKKRAQILELHNVSTNNWHLGHKSNTAHMNQEETGGSDLPVIFYPYSC